MSTGEAAQLNDPWWIKLCMLTAVVLATCGVLGVVGFFLWFLFPVEKIHGLTYLQTRHLLVYYSLINLMDVVGINFFCQVLYFRRVRTSEPVKDGILLGCYLVVFSWLLDIVVYVLIRQTLPTIQEYFLGKNQPEIGIAWLVAVTASVLAGGLEERRRRLTPGRYWTETLVFSSAIVLLSVLLTAIGVLYFDVRP